MIELWFQLTRPRGTRLTIQIIHFIQISFNSRVREGRDGYLHVSVSHISVSTHASARDATNLADITDTNFRVSTHASARDATMRTAKPQSQSAVSTHASARDATHFGKGGFMTMEFQLTRPRGTRRSISISRGIPTSFNSRVREGRDDVRAEFTRSTIVSTHASARDATMKGDCRGVLFKFQLTRPRGTRLNLTPALDLGAWFQLTRPRGTRPMHQKLMLLRLKFQLTRPRGTRLTAGAEVKSAESFNSRVREGRDAR